jgi:hypothetical protein
MSVNASGISLLNPSKAPIKIAPFSTYAAVSKLASGAGLNVPAAFKSVTTFLNSSASVMGNMTRWVNRANTSIALVNYAKNNLPGVALMVGAGIVSSAAAGAGLDENNVILSAANRAERLFKDPVNFLKTVSRANQNAEASFLTGGMNSFLNFTGSLRGLLLSARTLTDLVTGGVTGTIGPTVEGTRSAERAAAAGVQISANDVRRALLAVTTAMRGFGTLWDPNDADNIGTARGMIESLRVQGIADKISLDAYLLDAGVDPDVEIEQYGELQLRSALSEITGDRLQAIINLTGVRIYVPRERVRTAADLLEPYIVLPESALDHIPGAQLDNFGKVIASWGITNTATWIQIADVLDTLDIPDIPDINQVNLPSTFANLGPHLTSGSGLFGEAMVKDFIGTASGATHREAGERLSQASSVIQGSPEGIALKEAMDYYELHNDPSDPLTPLAEALMTSALEALRNSPRPEVQAAIEESNTACIDSALQFVTEVENAIIIGDALIQTVDDIITTAAAMAAFFGTPGAGEPAAQQCMITTASVDSGDLLVGFKTAFAKLGEALDAIGQFSGMAEMIEEMITNDEAGQTLRAAFAEARNKQRLAALGVNNQAGVPDIYGYGRLQAAFRGFGLTPKQIQIISTDAILRGIPVRDMLALNSLYGYNAEYYDALLFG